MVTRLMSAEQAGDATIAARFERQVAATPDAPAILTAERTVTYRELDDLAASMAGKIRYADPLDVSPVAIMIADPLTCIAAMLGAMKAERIFVPLDFTFPEDYLAQILADCGSSLILTDIASAQHAQRVRGMQARVVEVDAKRIAHEKRSFARLGLARPNSAAFIIYTSGSTGKPKGVVASHEFLFRYQGVWSGIFNLGPGDRMALLRTLTWGSGTHNAFAALLSGACVCPFNVASGGLGALSKCLADARITMLVISTALFRTWIAALAEEKFFPDLRLIRSGGDPLYGEDVVRARRHFAPGCQIAHSLGMTEVGTVTINRLDLSVAPEPGILPVGYPTPGVEVRIENESGGLAQTGEAGEIVVSGRQIALGYWKDASLTDAVFHRSPQDPSIRSYRTGDFGRWRNDGQLEYLGRKDRKVKLRGFTIELYEIENALRRLGEVEDAIVLLHKDGPEDAHLVAYVVGPKDDSQVVVQSMRARLAGQLPAHMIPSDIVVLKSLPLSERGKVDLKALPPPPNRKSESEESHRAASGEMECALAQIWQEVLNIPTIGVDADFYDLGGTSLQAFLIFARIATRLGRDLPPTTMMSTPTIASQAELLDRATGPGGAGQLVSFRRTGHSFPLFIVHGAFGDIMFVRELVRDLKSDRPVYGLQPPPLDGAHRVPHRMEEIAADYLAEIRKVQPVGPYLLAGYSFGGWAALEMAQQLMRTGERVAFLGMIDTNYGSRHAVAGERTASRVARHMKQLRKQPALTYLGKRISRTVRYCAAVAREATRQLPNELRYVLGRPIPYEQRAPYYRHIYVYANRHYSPQPYRGAIAMFARQGHTEWHRSRWLSLALGGLTIREVPAGHTEIVWPPYSAMLAKCFDACLNGAP